MAGLSENPRVGKTVRYGVALESTYGTEVSAGGGANVVELTCDDVTVDRGLNIQDFKISHGSNQPIAEESVRNLSGSAATFTISGPLDSAIAGIFAGAFYQTGTWTAETFTGPFTPYDEGSHPDYDGDQKSFTFYVKDPVAARDTIVKGCVCTSFKISGEKKGVLMFEAAVQGKSSEINQTLSGTWQTSGSAADGYGRVHFEDCTYQLNTGSGDTAVAASSFEVSNGYNTVEQEQPDGSGGYDALAIVGINGSFTSSFLKDASAASADTKMAAGSIVTFTIGGAIDIVCTGKINSVPAEREGLAKVSLEADMRAADEDSDMISVNW